MKTLGFMIVALIILGLSLLIATFIVFISMTLKNIWKETTEEDEYYQKQLLYQDRLKRISRGKNEK